MPAYKNACVFWCGCTKRECREYIPPLLFLPFSTSVFVYVSTIRGREEVHALSTYSTRIFDKTANSERYVPEIKRCRVKHTHTHTPRSRNLQKMHGTQRIMRSIQKSLRQMPQLLSGVLGFSMFYIIGIVLNARIFRRERNAI